MKKKSLIIVSAITLIDQLIKIFVDKYFKLSISRSVIPKFLYLTKTYNYGASWSILIGKRILLILITIIALLVLLKYQKSFKDSIRNVITFSLIYGGLFGNLVDRLLRGYVIDYIELRFGSYIFPIFNLADICLVIGFFLLIIAVLKGDDKYANKS